MPTECDVQDAQAVQAVQAVQCRQCRRMEMGHRAMGKRAGYGACSPSDTP
jgi:hypothetical protein